MDALTNVVAVLIFVLLLVNTDVTQKVVKMMEDMVPVTEEDMQKVKDMLKNLELDKKQLEELLKQPPPSQIDIDQLQKQIAELQAKIAERKTLIEQNNQSHAELQKLHDQVKTERDAEQKETETLMAEIDRLESLLDTTPVAKDIPPTEILIPEVKMIPENSSIYRAYVNGDRVHLVDPYAVYEIIEKQFASKKKDLLPDAKPKDEVKKDEDKKDDKGDRGSRRDRKSDDKKKDEPIRYDREKVLAFLRGLDFKLPLGQTIVFSAEPWDSRIRFSIRASGSEGGTTLADLEKPGNLFASSLSRLRPPKDVLLFAVDEKAMFLYAQARKLVESRNIPCGWELSLPSHPDINRRNNFIDEVPEIFLQPTDEKPKPAPKPPGWKPPERARSTGPKLG